MEQNSSERPYVVSYLVIRATAGVLGIILPVILILGDVLFLDQTVKARGSISAYYYSPMRDLFVGILFMLGVLLITYMAGRWNRDFWTSLIAGVAVIGVAMAPTDPPKD